MARIDVSDLDLTRELRLRRWARENFVAAEERDRNWHPVVHHEMQLIEEERENRAADAIPKSRFVPLMPGEGRSVHGAQSVREPRISRALQRAQRERHQACD